MVVLLVHIYMFVAWTGAWSTHSGLSAVVFLFLWAATLVVGFICAFFAPSILTILMSNGAKQMLGKEAGRTVMNAFDFLDIARDIAFFIPLLFVAVVAFFGYLLGAADLLNWLVPSLFPKGGYLFSEASIPWYAYLVPLYLVWTYYSLLDRFGVTDAVKRSIPEVKSAAKEIAKETGQRSVVLWNAYSPAVKRKGGAALGVTLREGRAFCLLNMELLRYVAKQLALLATYGRGAKSMDENLEPEKDSLADNLRHHIDEHRKNLKFLWHESRHFTTSFWTIVCLAVLVAIVY